VTKSPSQLPTAAAVTDDDVLVGNDGTVTKQFPASVVRAYAVAAHEAAADPHPGYTTPAEVQATALGGDLTGTINNAQIGAGTVGFPELATTAKPVYNVRAYGATGDGTTNDRAAFLAAFQAAEDAGGGRVVYAPAGHYNVGDGLSLSGFSSVLVGDGSSYAAGGTIRGTVLHATTATGPVLDLAGWVPPDSYRGVMEFGGFALRGSNVADATRARKGLNMTTAAAIAIRNILVLETGGAGVDFGGLQLSFAANITVITPVAAKANDVPYFQGGAACNGNRFVGLGVRSVVASDDTGASGAFLFDAGATTSVEQNLFLSCWVEYLHVPTNGCLFHLRGGNSNVLSDLRVWDSSKESGATGTAVVRLSPPTSGTAPNYGGNLVRGMIPGRGASATNIDYGVEILQSRNSVDGVKGNSGNNVRLASGVVGCSVRLHGAEADASTAAVVNDSGNVSNVVVDDYRLHNIYGDVIVDFPEAGGSRSLRVSRTSDSTIGAVKIGTAGAEWHTVAGGGALYGRADSFYLRSLDAAKTPLQVNARFGPAFVATPDGGQHAIQAAGNLKHTDGGRLRKTTTVTANYAMNYFTDDVVFANAAGITVTLPRADFAEAGREYLVKNISAGSVTVDVAASGGTIDGAASVTLAAAEALAVISTGTNFGRV